MNRILNPSLNPAGLSSAALALYALGIGIWNVTHHAGAIDPQVIVAAMAAVAALFTRQVVTPVADPKDGANRPLKPLAAPPAEPSPVTGEQLLEWAKTFVGQTGYGAPDPQPASMTPVLPPPPVSSDPRERSAQ